jgi:SpoVK/Ycf46/Vps4 family AAA+-type ATPase
MIVSSAMGLTTVEAESAFSMALVNRNRGSIPKLVLQEKAVAVRKTGILEYSEPGTSLDDIGGLEILKKWVIKRKSAFTRDAREYGLPTPKGILLVGVPGGGKSLAAKCISTGLDVPLIRFDIARVFAGLVGESESQMRNALQFIDGVGPCVVWVDEMEKAFAGAGGSGSNDSGVTKRVFGNFLTWMQEKTAPSFVVATCNSIEGIPPEMLRKGRFDENFYVGVPTNKGRIEISRIMANKFAKNGNIQHEIVAKASAQYTGAEIEAAYQEAMFTVYDEGKRPMVTDDVCRAIKNMNPITKAFALEIGNMLKWAQDNAVNASLLDDAAGPAKVESGGRVLTLA